MFGLMVTVPNSGFGRGNCVFREDMFGLPVS